MMPVHKPRNTERRVDDARLGRIEAKLDRLGEAMETLAKVEERIAQQQDQIMRMQTQLDLLNQDKIRQLESSNKDGRYFKERVLWAVAVVVLVSLELIPEGVLPF